MVCNIIIYLSIYLLHNLLLLSVLHISPLASSGGSCPPTLPVDVCGPRCGPEKLCRNETQLCCPTACGGSMCVDPVTERHFVTEGGLHLSKVTIRQNFQEMCLKYLYGKVTIRQSRLQSGNQGYNEAELSGNVSEISPESLR